MNNITSVCHQLGNDGWVGWMETESLAGCCHKTYNPLCGVIVWLCRAVRRYSGRVMQVIVTMKHSNAIRSHVRNVIPFIERIFQLFICIQQVCPFRGQRMETTQQHTALLSFRSVSLCTDTWLLGETVEMEGL